MNGDKLLTGDELAQSCADIMWSNDNASRALGMEIKTVSQGKTKIAMMVREEMTNGQKYCHGGYIFTLADSAFAYACNGYNQFTVAQHCTISFVYPAYLGDQLVADAHEVFRKGRGGIYDVIVTNQNEDIVAVFRGNSRTTKGKYIPDDTQSDDITENEQ